MSRTAARHRWSRPLTAALRGGPPRAESAVLVVAANFPDLDFLLGVLGTDAYLLWHRGLTHSVFGMPIFAAALAVLAHALIPGLSLARALLLCGTGFVSHLLLDLPTAWGTLALYPLANERFAWNWLFIVDPVLWGLLALAIAGGVRRPERSRRRSAAAGLALVALYILAAGGLNAAARAEARRAVAEERAAPAGPSSGGDVIVFPRPLAPWRWHAVAWQGDSLVRLPLSGIPPRTHGRLAEAHRLGEEHIRAALRTPAGQSFLWWAEAPVGRVLRAAQGATVVRLNDLRYAERGGGEIFSMDLTVAADGRLVEARWQGEPVFDDAPSPGR